MMKPEMWKNLIGALPADLTVSEVSQIFRRSESVVRARLAENGYKFRHLPKHEWAVPEWVNKTDWDQANVDIARQIGMSREIVRRWRYILKKPKVEARGRKLVPTNGKTLMEVFAAETKKEKQYASKK